ncbi:uncharacterized protein O9250_016132 [Rhynochetos jubatus]
MCWGSPGPGKVRNQLIALSKADSPSEEDPEGVSVVLQYALVDMKIVLNLLKSEEPEKNRCQGETLKTLALAQLQTGLSVAEGFAINVISPVTPDACTEPGISRHCLPFSALFILTPLHLALRMLCCKETWLENISTLSRSHAVSQGVAGYQTSSVFPDLFVAETAGMQKNQGREEGILILMLQDHQRSGPLAPGQGTGQEGAQQTSELQIQQIL